VRETREQAKAAIDQGLHKTALQRLIELAKLRLIADGGDPASFDAGTFFSYVEPDFRLSELVQGKSLPLIGTSHTFSASALNIFNDCPLRYKFQHVLLVPSSPRTYFSLGSAVHGVVEQLSRDNINGIPFSKERALALLDAGWDSSAYPNRTQGAEDRKKAEVLLDTFLDWQAKNTNTILAAEQRFRFRLGDRTVTGYIDRIERQPDGGLVVIDFKTGAKPGNITKAGIREDIQMNVYCMAVQEMYGKIPIRASLYYLKDDKDIDYIPDEESIAAFKERLQGMIAAVCAEICAKIRRMNKGRSAGKIPPVPAGYKKRDRQGKLTITLFSGSRFSWGTGCRKYVTKSPNSDHNCVVEYPGEDMRSAPSVSLTVPVTSNERYTCG
jgi:DNA helicase-2/ATP-dependent DNA helicase PcrA